LESLVTVKEAGSFKVSQKSAGASHLVRKSILEIFPFLQIFSSPLLHSKIKTGKK
jgi:hypothetical protein